jgi:hypothetical protein
MRKSLMIVLTLVAFAFVASDAGAGKVTVTLTKDQVNNVCGNTTYCEKPCGPNKEYTCGFGCGSKGCSGECLTCPGAARVGTIRTIVKGAVAAGASSRQKAPH